MDPASEPERGETHAYREQQGNAPRPHPGRAGGGSPVFEEAYRSLLALRRSTPPGVSFEPIAAAMVESVLGKALARHGVPPAAQRSLSQQIARSLSDDAVAGPRLEEFWDQLEALANEQTG